MTTSSSRPLPRPLRSVPPPAGSAASKASFHARFIPREELGGFAAWSPGDLGGAGAGADGSGVATRSDNAEADAARHAAELRQARQSGYQDGYRDGLVALEGFKQSFAQQSTQQIGVLVRSVGNELDAMQQTMAEALALTAVNLARQIVRSELAERPAAVASVAGEALETLLLSARHITLRVHPDDHALVAQGAADVIAARGARLIGDSGVTRGGCRVESDIGTVDASIETRWRRATAALGVEPPWVAPAASEPAP